MPKDDEKQKIEADTTLEMPVVPDPVLPKEDKADAKPETVPPTKEECEQAVANSRRALATLGIFPRTRQALDLEKGRSLPPPVDWPDADQSC